MSASLVGSEMCIRDRGNVFGCAPAPRARRHQVAPISRRPAPRRREPCACLLYTSDAADDM
eukprot:7508864-Alexandrium_andersonii.AAC.1